MTALVIDGHPNADSFAAEVARSYARGFGQARVLALRDLDFDVHLRAGYSRAQPLEPDLAAAWSAIETAEHIVVVTPIWWGATPALLSGFFDRVLLPRRAFRFSRVGLPIGMLAGRSGRLLVTTDSPRAFLALQGDPTVRSVRDGTMKYCGIAPTAVTRIGPVRSSSSVRRQRWLDDVVRIGARDAETVIRSEPKRRRRAERLARIPSRPGAGVRAETATTA